MVLKDQKVKLLYEYNEMQIEILRPRQDTFTSCNKGHTHDVWMWHDRKTLKHFIREKQINESKLQQFY